MNNFELHFAATKEELAEIRDRLRLLRSFILVLLGAGFLIPVVTLLLEIQSIPDLGDTSTLGLIISMVIIFAVSVFTSSEIKRLKALHDKKVAEIRDFGDFEEE